MAKMVTRKAKAFANRFACFLPVILMPFAVYATGHHSPVDPQFHQFQADLFIESKGEGEKFFNGLKKFSIDFGRLLWSHASVHLRSAA